MKNTYRKSESNILLLSYFFLLLCIITQANYCAKAPSRVQALKIKFKKKSSRCPKSTPIDLKNSNQPSFLDIMDGIEPAPPSPSDAIKEQQEARIDELKKLYDISPN